MRKISFVLTLAMASILISCQQNRETLLTGTFENYDKSPLLLFDMTETWLPETISVNNSKFSQALNIQEPVFKYIEQGINKGGPMVFIAPGYSLNVAFKNDNYEISGKGSLENNILESILEVDVYPNWNSLKNLKPKMALKHIDSLSNKRYIKLHQLARSKPTDPLFIEYAKALINYEAAIIKSTLALNNINDPGYYSFFKDIDLENEKHLEVPGYARLLINYIEIETQKSVSPSKLTSNNPEETLNAELKIIEKFTNKKVLEYLIFYKIYNLLKYNGINTFEKYHKYFDEHNTNPHYKAKINEVYSSYKLILGQGKPAPSFSCVDMDSNIVSLKDFSGKYVYIHFWEAPTIQYGKSISDYIKLQSEYTGKEIVFVNISLDADKNVWEEIVTQNKSLGISLYNGQGERLKQLRPYKLWSMPRFVLIDPNGKIIDAYAPMPSSIEIRKTLDELLSKK